MISQNSISRSNEARSQEKSWLLSLISGALLLILIAHFTIVGFYQFPDNPLKHQYKRQLEGYIDPFFSQTWTLFAPLPINTNMSLLVQFKYPDGNTEKTTQWIDVSVPARSEREKNFWSPAQRISKFLNSSMQDITEYNIKFYDYLKEEQSVKRDTNQIKKDYTEGFSQTFGHVSIMRYSKHVARNYFAGINKAPTSVEVRYKIFNAKFPRFSNRKKDYYDLKNYTFSEVLSDFYKL